MPLYEYKCLGCGETFEVLQRFSDPQLKVHQACGGLVERIISPSAFQFKGTGFYVTDYAKGSSKDSGQASNGSATASSSEGKSNNSKGSDDSKKSADSKSRDTSGAEKGSSTSDPASR